MKTPAITVSMAFVRGLLSGVQAKGESCDTFLQQAGISTTLLNESESRVTAEQYVTLFDVLMRQRDDEGLGFFGRPLRRGTFALVMRSSLSAPNVLAALRRGCQALQLQQDVVRFEFTTEGALTGMLMLVPENYYPKLASVHELVLRLMSRFVVWLHGGRIRAHGYDFSYPAPSHVDEYEKLFSGQVRFNQPCSAMWFQTEQLMAPMRRDETALREFLLQTPRNVVIPRRHDDVISGRVRSYLQQVRPAWPDLPATAAALHMSISTLQRQLSNEETSFQIIKDQLRRDLAIMRLNTSQVPLAVLAAELGFSDYSVFQRAFKMWTGSAPGSYRQHPKLVVKQPATGPLKATRQG